MNKKLINNHNAIIKYRNLILESKGINPKMYYAYITYFNKLYFLFNSTFYIKDHEMNLSKKEKLRPEEFIRDTKDMFGLNNDLAREMFTQLIYDLNLINYVSGDVTNNWDIITLPDTHEILEDYPF